MTEDQLQHIEFGIGTAGADEIASILLAAIVRVGELGRPAAEALDALTPVDAEIEHHWHEGADWVATVLAGDLAK